MRLTVVGCSGSYPGPDSPASCYLVEADQDGRTWRVLLDLGSGALGRLHRHADPLSIDGVFISHLHPDHWFDMSGYYVLRKYHPAGRQPRVPVHAPKGAATQMARAYGLPENPGMTGEFDFHVHDEARPVTLGPFTVEVLRVVHPVEAYALKVTADGRSLVYTGDTGPNEPLVDFAKDSDLLLAEASFVEGEDNPADLHLTGKEAGEAATAAGVGRLLLTHIPPWYDKQIALEEARPVYDGQLDLARCGTTYDV